MNKAIRILVFLACLCAIGAQAQTAILGGLTTVNNTTAYSSTNIVATNYPPNGILTIQHAALVNTNDYVAKFQYTIDGTNFITLATCNPSSIVAGQDKFTIATNFTLSFRVAITSTNSVQVGGSYSQPPLY